MQQMPLLVRKRSTLIARCIGMLSVLALIPAPALLRGQQQAAAWQRITTSQAPPASALPATRPTAQSTPPATLHALPVPTAATSASLPPNRAEVTYSDGLLDVRADNSSLHQILRAISRSTGMTITGNIGEVRVFGDYGPAPTSTVLATLIDGTGVNMLFQAGDATHPPSLVLTPQTGSPGLVNATPIAANADDAPNETATPARQYPVAATPSSSSPVPPALPTTSTTTNSTGTGGSKTPEQIYQELLQMQQRQQRPGQPAPSSPPQP